MNDLSRSRHPAAAFRLRRGLTLLELLLSLAITSMILAALGSSVLLVTRGLAIERAGATARTGESARLTEQLAADLKLAVHFSTPLAADTVQFTVPDRDGDDQADTIRYAWSGPPDHLLTRQILLSGTEIPPEPVVIAEDVRQFDLSYVLRTWGPPAPPPFLESGEKLLIHHDDDPADAGDQLLLVTAAAGITAQEAARVGLFSAWGYAVSTLGATADPAEFDVAVAAADVAFVSEEVASSDVGTKLRDATIGVVNEEVNLVDEFGVAGDFGFPPPDRILDVTVTTHPLTSAFAGGPTTVFSTDQAVTQLSTVADELSPGFQVLGAWGSVPALAVLLPDAELHSSGDATPDAFGYETVFGHVTGYSDHDKDHVATRVVLGEGAKVTGLTAYLDRKHDKDVSYGIYADDGGEPGVLLTQTPQAELLEGVGWETIDLEEPINLLPGTYWLAIGMKKDVKYFFEHAGGAARLSLEDSDELMPQWINTTQSTDRRISIHANYVPTEFAAGRRVSLPWGGNAFDINALTDEGRTLLQRSLAWAADTTPADDGEALSVEKLRHVAQCFRPALPDNALGWSITRILVAIRSDPVNTNGKVRFQLRYLGGDQLPSEEVMQETSDIHASTWDSRSFSWYEIPFSPQADLNPYYGVCLVMIGKDDKPNAYVMLDRDGLVSDPEAYTVQSTDQGGSWSAAGPTDDVRFYVYGSYTTTGAEVWP